ncbi:MAG: hypothetical protein Q8Q31_01600 [Nanoarchaeota archaeon]|nr:hypothetical protein [Nanoarchaeota archaeon]
MKQTINRNIRIVNEELMLRVHSPIGPPKTTSLSFLHYFSPTEIHRYSGRPERFLEVGNGLVFDGSPHIISFNPEKSYYPAERKRLEEAFSKRKKQLDAAGLSPVLNYII